MAIVLYDQLTGNKTTGGTWTKTSVTGPAAPGTYNGSIDLTGYPAATYSYRYTVTSSPATDTSDLSIVWATGLPVYNDECAGATTIATHNLSLPGETIAEGIYLTDEGDCTKMAAATLSAETVPTAWGETPTADIWFKIPYIAYPTSEIAPIITISSAAYPDEGADQLMIAAYSGECGTLTLLDAGGPVSLGQLLTIIAYIGSPITPGSIWLRIAIPADSQGYFDITIQTNL